MELIDNRVSTITSQTAGNQTSLDYPSKKDTIDSQDGTESTSAQITAGVTLSLSPEALQYIQATQDQESQKQPDGESIPTNRDTREISTYQTKSKIPGENKLSDKQLQAIKELKSIDTRVKNHEQQHMAVAGAYAKGGPSYKYEAGPDGIEYAVAGEIQLDMSPVPNDLKATIAKMERIHAGALAPSDPSGTDLATAAAAEKEAQNARMELIQKNTADMAKLLNHSSIQPGAHQRNHSDKVANRHNKSTIPGSRINYIL